MQLYRHKLLSPMLLLSLTAVAFRFDGSHVAWFWHAQPGVAVALVAGAATCAGLMLVPPRGPAPR